MDDVDDDLSEGELSDEEEEQEDKEKEEDERNGSNDNDDELLAHSIYAQHITTKIAAVWKKRKPTFNSNYTTTGWILSTIPQV